MLLDTVGQPSNFFLKHIFILYILTLTFKEESFEFKRSDCILHAALGELYRNGVSERELIPQAVAPAQWAVK